MKKKTTLIANVRVGKPDVDPGKPAHVKGVRQGNSKGHTKRAKGFKVKGQDVTGRASRSTGINPKDREPIDPRMPNLSPS
jgi:hypothetical protein